MDILFFNTYKAAAKLPLQLIAAHFNIQSDMSWREYIKIKSDSLEKIYMYKSEDKLVYIYKYGCISFVNFKQHEIQQFLEYLRKLYVELDDSLLLKFNDTHVMTIKDNMVTLGEDTELTHKYSHKLIDITATVLAKSIELSKIETELSNVLDDAGHLIKYLNAGRLRANSKKVIGIIAKCTRFKYRTIESVRLLDRPPEYDKTIDTRNLYDNVSDIYELNERYIDVLSRTDVLDSITEEYFNFKSNQSENRLLMFEILLLAVFPIMHFLR